MELFNVTKVSTRSGMITGASVVPSVCLGPKGSFLLGDPESGPEPLKGSPSTDVFAQGEGNDFVSRSFFGRRFRGLGGGGQNQMVR